MERKEAIEIVKKNFPDSNFTMLRKALETLIPELQNEDERIRKTLIKLFTEDCGQQYGGFAKEKIVVWLKKQSNNNSSSTEEISKSIIKNITSSLINYLDNNRYEGAMNMSSIECEDLEKAILDSNWGKVYRYMQKKLEKQGNSAPDTIKEERDFFKFHEGDWIVTNDGKDVFLIKNIDCGYCALEETNGIVHFPCLPSDNDFHHWTIQDAKDGDVVVDKSNGAIGIFQSIGHDSDGGSHNDPSYCFLHCRYVNGFFYADFENGNMIDADDLIPAIKEQRELLFTKMKEAGFEWGSEKKELISIENKS